MYITTLLEALTKLIVLSFSFPLNPINKFNLLSNIPVFTNNPNKNLVNNTITNIVTIVEIISIVANPLTVLSPNINKIIATNKVVMFESKIAINEFLLPFL